MRKCDFCGEEKTLIVTGIDDDVTICASCAEMANSAFNKKSLKPKAEVTTELKGITPSKIKSMLDEYVIGQVQAKEKLAVAIYNQKKAILAQEMGIEVEIDKSNVLLVGPTGSGKTYMLKTLAKKLGVPLSINDATTLTSAGYVGDDVENCIRKLVEAADGDIKKAERGIIFVDEIDKIGRKGENVSITRDVSGEGVQQSLLKYVEGAIAEVPPKGGRKHPDQACIKVDTTNILWVIGGSFEGIEKIIAKRTQGKAAMGIGAKIVDRNVTEFNEYIEDLKTEDLKKFGMLPEFLGRFPIIAPLKELDKEALISILTEPKNALIKQYKELFKLDDIDLIIKEEALDKIAEKAMKNKTGARGLRAIMDGILLKQMYNAPEIEDTELVIDAKDVV